MATPTTARLPDICNQGVASYIAGEGAITDGNAAGATHNGKMETPRSGGRHLSIKMS